MPKAYYNEHDKSAAEWLRELIKAGVITDGTVDERSIEDVVPAELAEFDRCHFFAGIGVWDHALTRAGWPDDRRVWTGSCPCQPFSAAGKGDGFADERHLWPAWFHLIEQCRPRTIFGEQVSSKDTLRWIDLVHADLEGALYTVGAADLCSPSVGAPHIRQRLYFVAESSGERFSRERLRLQPRESRFDNAEIGRSGETHELAKPVSVGRRGRSERPDEREIRERGCSEVQIEGSSEFGVNARPESGNRPIAGSGGSGGLDDSGGDEYRPDRGQTREADSISELDRSSGLSGRIIGTSGDGDGQLGDSDSERSQRLGADGGTQGRQDSQRPVGLPDGAIRPGPTNGFWRDAEWIYCRDGKWRPVGTIESGAFEMADELAADLGCVRDQSSGRYTISPLIEKGKGRVSRLRGYGNAIVAEVAVKWIESYLGK